MSAYHSPIALVLAALLWLGNPHSGAATDDQSPRPVLIKITAAPMKTLPVNEYTLLKTLNRYDLYRRLLDLRASGIVVSQDGAVGRNTAGYMSAAFQRDVVWLLMRSIANGNTQDLDATVLALKYAFRYQTQEGNFKNTLGYDAKTAVGADAFFIQAFARIHTVLQAGNKGYASRLDSFKPNLVRALRWLRGNSKELLRQDGKATNRLLFDAIALTLGGQIVADQAAQELGQSFLDTALSNQRPDGSFDEHDGSDTSYQAVSILNLGGLLLNERQSARKAKLAQAYCRAVQWEASKVSSTGEVSVVGNSRTGSGQEMFFGKPKDVNYYEVILSFYQASAICNAAYANVADSILRFATAKR